MNPTTELKKKLKTINITNAIEVIDELLINADKNNNSYLDFLNSIVDHEIKIRSNKQLEKRLGHRCH